jgi:hypothetical protein
VVWLCLAPARVDAQVADFHAAAPGRVVLRLESEGAPLRVVLETRSRAPQAERTTLGAGSCVTPCVLHVPPGTTWLRADGPRLRAADEVFEAPGYDAALRLRAPTRARWNIGIGLVAVGLTTLVALTGISVALARDDEAIPVGAVAGLALTSVVMLGVGVPLVLASRTGVSSITPLARP